MEPLRSIFRRFPVKLLLAVTLISQVVGQCHPFSRFPMYSSFPAEADIFYITDKKGHPIPSLKALGIMGPEIKQRVEHKRAELAGPDSIKENFLMMKAGEFTLRKLATERAGLLENVGYKELVLRQVRVTRKNGELVTKEWEVATWP